MTIAETIQDQIKEAMRSKNVARLSALRMIRAAMIEEAKSGAGELDDERSLAAIGRVKKQRVDAAETYKAVNRPDLAELELQDARICDEFLPKLADEATLEAWVEEALVATGARSGRELGKVMGTLVRGHKGAFDPAMARALVEKALARFEQ
jgi:uncharacterized protein